LYPSSGCWDLAAPTAIIRPTTKQKRDHDAFLPIVDSCLAGALDFDPIIRDLTHEQDLTLSEHALWLILIASRQFVMSVLQNAVTVKLELPSVETKTLNARDVGHALCNITGKHFHSSSRRLAWAHCHHRHGLTTQPILEDVEPERVQEINNRIHHASLDIRKQEYYALNPGTANPSTPSPSENSSDMKQRLKRGRGMKDLLALRIARSERNLPTDEKQASGITTFDAVFQNVSNQQHPDSDDPVAEETIATDDVAKSKNEPLNGEATAQVQIASTNSGGGGGGGRRVGMKDLAALRARKMQQN